MKTKQAWRILNVCVAILLALGNAIGRVSPAAAAASGSAISSATPSNPAPLSRQPDHGGHQHRHGQYAG